MDPVVVATLQPFIVTSWHGHRHDSDLPSVVARVWREKFSPRRKPEAFPSRQSNVDWAILNSEGQLVDWFDSMPSQGRGPRNLAAHATSELHKSITRLNLPRLSDPPRRPVRLPDLDKSRGLRVIVTLQDKRMTAYRAPLVEVVHLNDDDWAPLNYSHRSKTVDASQLSKWLSQVYPPGVMERTNPRTKRVYRIQTVTGDLAYSPAGSNREFRYAVLTGRVRLTDEGPDRFSYAGRIDLALTYPRTKDRVASIRGTFAGIYPRFDRKRQQIRHIPLEAVFESRPPEGN